MSAPASGDPPLVMVSRSPGWVGTATTSTTMVSVAVVAPLVTVRVTVRRPTEAKVWFTCAPVAAVVPSPKSQL